MRIKKVLRFFMLFFFLLLAAMVPFPIKFNRKDNTPTYTIEQIDKKEDEEKGDEYQAFS